MSSFQPRSNAASTAVGHTSSSNLYGTPGLSHADHTFSKNEETYLVGLYYSNFHCSHPMLVPRAYFAAQQYPDFLVFTICLVGHHFAPSQPPESFISAARGKISSALQADSTHRIQAFVLLSLVYCGTNETSSATDCLCSAISLAAEIHFGSPDSCLQETPHGIKQETLRRTWWELFTIDALLALLQGRPPKIKASDPDILPSVPCAEVLYEEGSPTERQSTYAEFERRMFLQQPPIFSSHFYRIQAALLMRRVQPFFAGDDVDPQGLEAVDNAIASWSFHLPDSGLDLSTSTGQMDHILMQANPNPNPRAGR